MHFLSLGVTLLDSDTVIAAVLDENPGRENEAPVTHTAQENALRASCAFQKLFDDLGERPF